MYLTGSDGGNERSSRAWSGSSMARRSGEQEQEHDEERARSLAEKKQEHGEGRAQRLKQGDVRLISRALLFRYSSHPSPKQNTQNKVLQKEKKKRKKNEKKHKTQGGREEQNR